MTVAGPGTLVGTRLAGRINSFPDNDMGIFRAQADRIVGLAHCWHAFRM